MLTSYSRSETLNESKPPDEVFRKPGNRIQYFKERFCDNKSRKCLGKEQFVIIIIYGYGEV